MAIKRKVQLIPAKDDFERKRQMQIMKKEASHRFRSVFFAIINTVAIIAAIIILLYTLHRLNIVDLEPEPAETEAQTTVSELFTTQSTE